MITLIKDLLYIFYYFIKVSLIKFIFTTRKLLIDDRQLMTDSGYIIKL